MARLLWHLRYALRRLASQPSLTTSVLAIVALGVGANSAVFSMATEILLRPVPGIREQSRLVEIEVRSKSDNTPQLISYPNLEDLSHEVRAFSGLVGNSQPTPLVVAVAKVPPRYFYGSFVSSNYFDVLGVRMASGRNFDLTDEAPTSPAAAIISSRLRERVFGQRLDVAGQALSVNGIAVKVVGVVPYEFEGVDAARTVDLWIPVAAAAAVIAHDRTVRPREDRAFGVFGSMVGRLRPNTPLAVATSEITVAVRRLAVAYAHDDARWSSIAASDHLGLSPENRDATNQAVLLLAGIAAAVLLIACANVGHLFLVQSLRHQREWRLRLALGARIAQLIQVQACEALLVAVIATPGALVIGGIFLWIFRRDLPVAVSAPRVAVMKWQVVLFTAGVATFACVVSSISPLLFAMRKRGWAASELSTGRNTSEGHRLQSGLAAFQVGLSLSMLTVTLLFATTLRQLRAVPVGFDAEKVSSFALSPALSGYSSSASTTLLREGLDRVRSIPGVEAAALSATAPFSGPAMGGWRVGSSYSSRADSGIASTPAWVSPTYFRTMGITLLRGRTFTDAESFSGAAVGSESTIILSRTIAQRLFGDADPIGALVSPGFPHARPARVIGVVADSRWSSLTGAEGPVAYMPIPSIVGTTGASFLIRSQLPRTRLLDAVQNALDAMGPSLAIFDAKRLSARIEQTLSQEQLFARLLTVFACLSVALAAIGVYALISFAVTCRTKELGVRIALGATERRIVWTAVSPGLFVSGIGVLLGVAGGAASARLVANRLYGVAPFDPATYLLAAALLLVVVSLASVVPAIRATRIDPRIALSAH